jgi:Concanavalin A-like lectin/glucanases superfamily
MSPMSGQPCCPGDLTDAYASLVDQFRVLTSRIAAVEAATTGQVSVGAGIVGPAGPAGPPGPSGPAGASGACDCPFSLADFNALKARVNAIEGSSGGFSSLGPYYDAVMADGPIALWPLNEYATADVFYDRVGGFTGTVDRHPSNVRLISFDGDAIIGSQPSVKSMFFPAPIVGSIDATYMYGRVSGGLGGAVNDVNGQSVEFWVRVTGRNMISVTNYQSYSFLHFGGWAEDYDCAISDFGGSGLNYSYFCEADPTGTGIEGLAHQLTDNADHHVVYTRKSGGEYRIYYDGALVDSRAAGPFSVGDGTLYLGGNAGKGNLLVGMLSHVAIYNKELTAARVNAHYVAGVG